MNSKQKERQKAIELRKKGLLYSEILKEVPVAKSTLSSWLQKEGIAKKEKQRMTKKRKLAQRKGAVARREQKIALISFIKSQARKEIKEISRRDLWMIGIALYWAEGTKEKKRAEQTSLGNSDPRLIKIYLKWLKDVCQIPKSEIVFRIHLHKESENRLLIVQKYWSEITGFPVRYFNKVRWKEHKIKTKRTNTGKKYFGLLEVRVKSSSNLNRKISGWIESIFENSVK